MAANPLFFFDFDFSRCLQLAITQTDFEYMTSLIITVCCGAY